MISQLTNFAKLTQILAVRNYITARVARVRLRCQSICIFFDPCAHAAVADILFGLKFGRAVLLRPYVKRIGLRVEQWLWWVQSGGGETRMPLRSSLEGLRLGEARGLGAFGLPSRAFSHADLHALSGDISVVNPFTSHTDLAALAVRIQVFPLCHADLWGKQTRRGRACGLTSI